MIVGKHRKVAANNLLKFSIFVFLPYYILYISLFAIRKKNKFLLLNIISRYAIPLEGIYYTSGYDNDPLNRIIYRVHDNKHDTHKSLSLPSSHRIYYLRKARDNMLLIDSGSSRIMVHDAVSVKDSLESYCKKIFSQRMMTLYDILCLKRILSRTDMKKISIKNIEMHDVLGFPLIVVYLFDLRYDKNTTKKNITEENGRKYKELSRFLDLHYSKEQKIVKEYLQGMDYEMPIQLYHFFRETKTFKIYSYLYPPIGYTKVNEDYGIFNPLIWILFKIKNHRLNAYMKKSYIMKKS